MKRVPTITDAKHIAQRLGSDAVVVISFRGGQVAAASYGADGLKCKATGKWVDRLVDAMCDGTLVAPYL